MVPQTNFWEAFTDFSMTLEALMRILLEKGTNKDYLPFLRSSGLPFLTVANTISPTAAAGRRFKRPLIPLTAIMYKFLAPEIEIYTNI